MMALVDPKISPECNWLAYSSLVFDVLLSDTLKNDSFIFILRGCRASDSTTFNFVPNLLHVVPASLFCSRWGSENRLE